MRPPDRVVAMTCIVLANRRPAKWFDGEKEVLIERGQFVRSREQMVEACKLPLQVVRTSIEHLELTKFLTRLLTRRYTMYTLPKYEHYQDLTKYSDNVSTISEASQPENQPETNHKQQQHTPPKSSIRTPEPDRRERTGRRIGDVVVVDPGKWADPILAKPSFRISSKLLESIHMADKIGAGYASMKPVGQILRVVQQARLQKNPGGWAKVALDSDWKMPEASGEELREVIDLVKNDVERLNAYFLTRSGVAGVKMSLPAREPGEDERSWMRRVTDELNRRKNGQRNNRGGPPAP